MMDSDAIPLKSLRNSICEDEFANQKFNLWRTLERAAAGFSPRSGSPPGTSTYYEESMPVRRNPDALRAIGWGGLIGGVLDISDALLFYGLRGVPPERLLQGIASGLLGARALKGGWPAAAVGLGLHFLIAFTAATVYYAASRKFQMLRERPIVSGLLYGIVVFLFMNMIVVPLSAIHRSPTAMLTFNLASVNAVLALMLFIGLPIAIAVNRYAREARRAA
jgi:hypothetical protein